MIPKLALLLLSSCATRHASYDALEEMGSTYLEHQYISSEMLLAVATESSSSADCRRFAGAAFWLEAIAESEVEYQLWRAYPERFGWGEPTRMPSPRSSSEFCLDQ